MPKDVIDLSETLLPNLNRSKETLERKARIRGGPEPDYIEINFGGRIEKIPVMHCGDGSSRIYGTEPDHMCVDDLEKFGEGFAEEAKHRQEELVDADYSLIELRVMQHWPEEDASYPPSHGAVTGRMPSKPEIQKWPSSLGRPKKEK